MPHISDESMVLADVYAQSLLSAAREQNAEAEVAAEFDELIRYMDQDPNFEAFLVAASVDDDPRRESLEKIFRGRMNDLLLNTLQVMNNRGRLFFIRQVHRCVVLRMEALHQQKEVILETAQPLTEELRAEIKQQVSANIGKEALLIERVVPELIGGIVIRIDDLQIDGSVATRINLLRERLSERAIREVHNRQLYIEEA